MLISSYARKYCAALTAVLVAVLVCLNSSISSVRYFKNTINFACHITKADESRIVEPTAKHKLYFCHYMWLVI